MMYAHRQTRAPYARLVPVPGGLSFESSFDRALVDAFKVEVPSSARKWDAGKKVWLVASEYGPACADLARRYLGIQVVVPTQAALPITETRLLRVQYIGRAKSRGSEDDLSAYAYADGSWSVIFPESVLREWFSAVPESPSEAPTLFAALGVKKTATVEAIKSAYRRMARLTHPDVNHEPDAAEQFKAIQHAWDVLSNDLTRRKYLAGLKIAAQARESQKKVRARDPGALYEDHMYDYDGNLVGYRCPIRCGWVLAEGQDTLGRFIISKILQWEDQVNGEGKTLVTSWPKDAKTFVEEWI
jgi:hypothetical protein